MKRKTNLQQILQTDPQSIIKSSTTGCRAVGGSKSPSSKTSSTSNWSLAFFDELWSMKELELSSTVSIILEPTSNVSTLASSIGKLLTGSGFAVGIFCFGSASNFFSVNLAFTSAVDTIALGLLSVWSPNLPSLGFSLLKKKTENHSKTGSLIKVGNYCAL